MANTETQTDSELMFGFGFDAGRDDAETGSWSEPILAEDGEDYSRGYVAGWNATRPTSLTIA
ncbi:MAG TPA: hypothetical protein VHZ96_26320 [Frankiaceae bacterium]|jgi:hypothetical protein|nr:hypothetical protein [Frankiaceae bacterium]